MEFLAKFIERVAPAWMPYVYLLAFIVLVGYSILRAYTVSRDMLRINHELGEAMKEAERRIDLLESHRDIMLERTQATNELLRTIHEAVLEVPRTIADSINAAVAVR